MSRSEEIVFEDVTEGLPVMAPFVSPIVEAKPQRRVGARAKTFRPAYVKPKHTVMPSEGERRRPGEALYGSIDPADRLASARLQILGIQKRQCEERWEWMAAKAVIDGRLTIASEDYPPVQVDFGRDPANEIVVTGAGNVWSNSAADVRGMLEDWSEQILERTGYAGTDVLLAPEVWKHLRQNDQLLRDLEIRRGARNVPSVQPFASVEGVRYVGAWGEFFLWSYGGRFREQDGERSRVLKPTDVVMVAPPADDGTGGIHGVQAFGLIQDPESMEPEQIFTKSWPEKDPPEEVIMSQSAPLMIPGRPNASIRATVLTP